MSAGLMIKKRYSPRPCPVCLNQDSEKLFRQQFDVLSSGSLFDGFDLVVCNVCGGAYADDVPDQKVFDQYYAQMSKYEYTADGGRPSTSDTDRFAEIVSLVSKHISPEHLLLDVGCATGGLLSEFKAKGFNNVLGVDPSPQCVRLAMELYSVPARALPISGLSEIDKKADVVFLTGVLEHLCDVEASLSEVKGVVTPGGCIYIEVPDASRYDQHFSAPYQLLSMEHVNYFSPTSLSALMARHGFETIFTQRVARWLGPQSIEPTIAGMFRQSGNNLGWLRDEETKPSLERYLLNSEKLEIAIHQRIGNLAKTKVPIAVWGTGTHTLRLLEMSPLKDANIVAFIDSNANYHGKLLAGRPIVSPQNFSDPEAEILISSQVAEENIYQTITADLQWKNRVHRLYSSLENKHV
jgi:SAM-dependent methyltransferase